MTDYFGVSLFYLEFKDKSIEPIMLPDSRIDHIGERAVGSLYVATIKSLILHILSSAIKHSGSLVRFDQDLDCPGFHNV